MNAYVALLRGINVGENSKVPMVELKLYFENLGYENVRTYINSGNVIFDLNEIDIRSSEKLEEALRKHFKFDLPIQ